MCAAKALVRLHKYSGSSKLSLLADTIGTNISHAGSNRADPDQAALKRAADQGLLCLLMEII